MTGTAPGRLEMRTSGGFSLVELLIALGLATILASLSVTLYMGYLRPAETVDALATLRVLREQASIHAADNQPLPCDGSLFPAEDLTNDYVEMTVTPVPENPGRSDSPARMGVIVSADVGQQGPESVVVARELHDELVGAGETLVEPTLRDSVVSFTVILSPDAYCEPATAVAAQPVQPPAQTAAPLNQLVINVTPPTTFSTTETQLASQYVAAGLTDPVFARSIADALASAKQSGTAASLPASAEAAKQLATCNIPLVSPCEDQYTGDCAADFGSACQNPQSACLVGRVCQKTCGLCQSISPEVQAFLDESYRDVLSRVSAPATP